MADTILFYGLIEFLMKISFRKYPIFDYHVALIQFCVVFIPFRVVLIHFHVVFIHFRVTFTLFPKNVSYSSMNLNLSRKGKKGRR